MPEPTNIETPTWYRMIPVQLKPGMRWVSLRVCPRPPKPPKEATNA